MGGDNDRRTYIYNSIQCGLITNERTNERATRFERPTRKAGLSSDLAIKTPIGKNKLAVARHKWIEVEVPGYFHRTPIPSESVSRSDRRC